MRHTEKIPETTPGSALQRWMRLAENHDVYLELDFGFAGVMEHPDSLPPRLAIELDAWMENLIRRCRDKDKADRWLRLKLAQQGDILRMECEAAGHPPESRKLREAGAYLEVEDMEESFFVALETGLRRPSPHDAWDRRRTYNESEKKDFQFAADICHGFWHAAGGGRTSVRGRIYRNL